MTNKKNYELFNDIDNVELRAWNRCAMIFNIGKEYGPKAITDYAGLITKKDRESITTMFNRIEQNGYESTRSEVIRNNHTNVIH